MSPKCACDYYFSIATSWKLTEATKTPIFISIEGMFVGGNGGDRQWVREREGLYCGRVHKQDKQARFTKSSRTLHDTVKKKEKSPTYSNQNKYVCCVKSAVWSNTRFVLMDQVQRDIFVQGGWVRGRGWKGIEMVGMRWKMINVCWKERKARRGRALWRRQITTANEHVLSPVSSGFCSLTVIEVDENQKKRKKGTKTGPRPFFVVIVVIVVLFINTAVLYCTLGGDKDG